MIPAALSVNLTTSSVTAGSTLALPIVVNNDGGDATQVKIQFNPQIFSDYSFNPIDIGGKTTTTAYATVTVKDVQYGWYNVNIIYTYNDAKGSHSGSSATQIYVKPNIGISDVAWQGQSISIWGWPPKDTIGKTDSTKIYFTVQSYSLNTTYVGLSALAKLEIEAIGLTITPATQQVEAIGPQGKSSYYNFTISSNNTPSGKYEISIQIMADNQIVATQTVELRVQ